MVLSIVLVPQLWSTTLAASPLPIGNPNNSSRFATMSFYSFSRQKAERLTSLGRNIKYYSVSIPVLMSYFFCLGHDLSPPFIFLEFPPFLFWSICRPLSAKNFSKRQNDRLILLLAYHWPVRQPVVQLALLCTPPLKS